MSICKNRHPIWQSSLSFPDPSSIDTHEWILIFGTSVASILGNLLLIPASRMATPTIVNMVRSTELLFAYAAQIIFFGKVPSPLVACGATFVLGSIVSMTFVEKIQLKLSDVLYRSTPAPGTKLESNIVDISKR